MRKIDRRLQHLLIGLSLLGLMVLSTCSVNKVGLGAKVDITPPALQITSPATAGTYVRGNLVLSGTVADDIKLRGVAVAFDQASGGTANEAAAVDGTAWSITIPSGTTDGIAEGQRTITVTATDDSGKATTATILVYIDNQTPTVLVTYPLSHGGTSALRPLATDTLDIKGEVADQSPVVKVVVTVLDSAGTVVATRSPTQNPNPKTADGTNTWSTRFYLKDPVKGLIVTDGQEYFYQVTATDNAGNTNSWYYHINDIPGLMPDLNPATPEKETGPLPTVSELGTLDHASTGVLSTPSGILYDDLVLRRLAGPGASAVYGNFQYSAVSAPTIRFSNLDQTKPQNQNLLSPGGVVTGTIAPPVNSGTIDTASLSVKLYQGATIPGTLLATYGVANTTNLELTNLGDSLAFTIPLKNGATDLPAGPYSITINAKAQTSSARTETVAFFLDAGAPVLTVNTLPAFTKALFSLNGTASSALPLDHIEITEMKDGTTMDPLANIAVTGTSASWDTGVVLPQNKLGGVAGATTGGTYEYAITLVATSGKRTSLYRSVTFDQDPPEMTADANPIVGTNTVNGTITVSGSATDLNGLAGVRWAIRLKSAGAPPTWTNTDSSLFAAPPYSTSLVTTSLTDETDYTLWFRSEDKAGNTKTASKDLHVSQASDLPVIHLTNLDSTITTATLAGAKANLLQNGAKILANVSDDDGVAASTIQAKIDGGAWTSVTKKGSDGLSTTFEQDVSSLPDGVHTASFQVTDKYGTVATLPAVAFVLDTAVPTLTVTGNAGWYQNSITLNGTASDANGLDATVPVKLVKDGGATPTLTITPTAGSWTTGAIALPQADFPDGTHTWSLVATDGVGKTTSQAITFQIDRTPPVMSTSNLATNDLFSTPTVTVLGTASDSSSGVSKVQYRLDGGTWTDATGTTSWTANITGLTDRLNYGIEFRAIDNAGNVTLFPSAPPPIAFRVDLAAPAFTETSSGITSGSVVYRSADVVFGGSVSDGNSSGGNNLASVVVSAVQNGTPIANLLTSPARPNGTWTATLPTSLGDGSYELTFTATDLVGKTTSFVRNVVIDTLPPDLTVTAPLQAGGELVSSASYTLRGQVTDNGGSGVASMEYSRDNSSWNTIALTGLNWTKTGVDFSSPVGAEHAQGGRTVYVRATDLSGHAVTKTVSFNYDTDDPVLTESTSGLTTSLVNRKTAVVFGGTATDTNAVARVRYSLNGVDKGDVTDTGTTFSTWTYTLPTTTEGSFALVFTVSDVAGRTATIARNVLIDTTAPTTPVFTSSAGAYVSTSLAIAGTTGDTGSGVQTVFYRVDGLAGDPATGTLTGTDDWFSTVNVAALPVGPHKVSVWSVDRAGNQSAEQFQNFTVDRADPVIASPAPASQGTNADLTLSGTASDDYLLGTLTAGYSKDGGPVVSVTPSGTSGAWSVLVPVANGSGSYVYTMTATDSVGRTKSLTRTVVIDVLPPSLTISNIASGGTTLVNGTTITVTGTAVDAGLSGLASVEYSRDGTTWTATTGTGSWIVPLSGLTDGLAQKFWLRAHDNAGNAAAELHYTFDVDLAPPTFTETNSGIASASVVYRNTDVVFAGTASDANGLASLTVQAAKNGGASTALLNAAAPANGPWTATLPTASGDGSYELTFTATDHFGKTTSFVRNVVIDTAQPDLEVTTPQANEMVDKLSYDLTGRVTDNGGKGVSLLQYSRDGSSWTNITLTGLNWTAAGVNFATPVGAETAEGARSVYFRTSDGLNLVRTLPVVTFFYDTTPPTIAETTSGLTASQTNRNAAVSFGGTSSDTNAVAKVTVSVNGAADVLVTDTNADANAATKFDSWSYGPLVGDGVYSLVFTSTDVAGRTTSLTKKVLLDTTAPATPVITSSPGAYVTGSLAVAGTTSDAGSGVQSVLYRIDGLAGDPATGTLTGGDDWFSTLDVSALGEGSHSVTVWAIDRAGNKSAESTPQTFKIDRNDPAIGSPAPTTQNSTVGVTLSGTASDTNTVASVAATVSKNGGAAGIAPVIGTGSWSIAVPFAADHSQDGSYLYSVTAKDGVGRTSSLTRTVVIDTTAPTLSVSSPADAAVVSDPSLTVSGSATDALSGVVTVEYRLNGGAWTALTGTSNWNGTVALGAEGTKVLEFRSTDALGWTSPVTTRTVNLDLTPPTLTETGIGTNAPKRNVDFTLSGAASDTNGLATWDNDGDDANDDGFTDASGNTVAATPKVPYVEVSTDGGTTKTKVVVSGGTWSFNSLVPSDGSGDGDRNFIVYAKDRVGKVTTVNRTVTVDATPPVLTIDGVIAGQNVTTGAVNGDVTFRFSANDLGVGLERGASYQAYYQWMPSGVNPPADMTTWNPTTSANSVFSFTFDTRAAGLSADEPMDLWVGVRDGVKDALVPAIVPNSSRVKTVLTVNQNSDRPVISIDNMNMGAATNTLNGFGQNPTILLTVEDDDAVNVTQLQYRVDADNDGLFDKTSGLVTAGTKWQDETVWNDVETVPTTNRSLAQAKIKLTGFPQGGFRLQIRARDTTDASSWSTIYGNASNFTWTQTPVIRFAVDYGPPTIAVAAPAAGTYNADFTVSGTASDAVGVVEVRYTIDGGSSYHYLYSDVNGSTSVPFSGTVDTSVLPSGEYTLQVEAMDYGNTTTTQQIPITIDRTPPSVTLLQPGVHETLNGASVVVRGEATDNRQLGAVFVWSGKVSDPDPAVLPSRTGPGTFNPGSYSPVTGASNWSTTINTTATVLTPADGYRIRLVAVDSIGNVGTPVDYLVTVDQSSDRPIIGFSNLVVSGLPTPSRLALGNLSIIGTATDDDSVNSSSIQIRVDRDGNGDFNGVGEGWVPVSQPPASNALVVSWVHEITDLFNEGLHHVQVRVLDINDTAGDFATGFGWNTSPVVPFFIDNGPPALEVTTPTLGQRFNVNNFTLTGKTQDTNGINRVVVWVDNNENAVQDAGETTVIGWNDLNSNGVVDAGEGSPLSSDNTQVNINQVISGLSDGTKTVRVSSYDSSNALTVRELTVVIDTTPPSATISTPTTGSTVNGMLSVIGTATDNYQVAKVYYNLQPAASAAPLFPAAYTELVGQTYAWNTSINTASGTYPDGAYTLRIVVADAAGNDSSSNPNLVNFTINQTTDRPVVAVLTVDAAGTAVQNLLPPSLAISGTVQDDDAVDKTKIQVRSRSLPAGAWSAWGPISGPPAANSPLAIWSHTFTGFTDGQYEFEVRAADINDTGYGINSSSATGSIPFSIDLSLPTGTIVSPVQASFHNTDVTLSGSSSDANGVKRVTIAFDSGSGYGAETVLYNDTNPADGYVSPYAWSTTYPVSNGDAQVFFRVTITDAFDKVRTLEQYFTVDTLAPTVSYLLPSPATVVNGSVLARGSANDGNQVSAVYFKVNNVTGPGTWATGDPVSNGWTLLAGKYNWEQRFKSTSLADGAARVYIMATDAAGNRSDPTQAANQLDFTVNQATNKPVVTITTPNNALLDDTGTITGTISDDDSVNASTVQIDLGDGNGWVNVTSASASGPTVTFTHSLTGVPERAAPYTIQVRASDVGEDFPGTADDIPAVTSDIASITVKKDNAPPTVGITNLNNGLLTVSTLQGVYLRDRLTLTGTASDGVQVAQVAARLPGITGAGVFTDVPVTNTGTNFSTWSWAVSGLTLPGTTVNLEVKVTDVNGRSTTTAYTLLVDTTAPTVAIETTALNPDTTSGVYNGTLTFRGSSADLVKVEQVYYRWGAAAAAAPAGNYTGWTAAGSTYSWSTAPFDTTTLFSDALDHIYHLSVVSVDSAGNESTVSDLTFTINQSSDRPTITLSQPTPAQVLETNAKSSGSASDDDGLATIEYRIDRDNNGDFLGANEGYTTVTTPAVVAGKSQNFEQNLSTLVPTLPDGFYRIQVRVRDTGYATAAAPLQTFHETESAVVSFSIDTAAPTLDLTQIAIQHRYDAGTTTVSTGFNGTAVNNDFTLKFTASDASGIASVQTSLDNTTFTPATSLGGTNYSADLPISAFVDGTRSVYYRATDNNNKVTSGLLTLLIDKTSPTVTFLSPSGIYKDDAVSNAPNVNGTAVTVTGSITDASSIASLTIVGGVTDNVPLTNTGNNTNWSLTFNSTLYTSATYATNVGGNVWRFPIKVTAYDAAGMRVISTGYVDLDPDGDKPIVSISTPLAGASVTGIITLNGTVIDDDGTTGSVDIGLDTNNDGVYTDQLFTAVPVSNGAWSQQINTTGTLSGTINFQVTPKDMYGKLGDLLQRTIFIDASLPSIVGYNGSAETAAPSPTTGTKQKGTITIRALFKDDDVIPAGNIQVSLDGGTTYVAASTLPGYSLNDLGVALGKHRYDVQFNLNTATYFANNSGNGSASVILQVTDNTYKPAVVSLSYAVDNRPPELSWDPASTLSPPQAGVYSFYGSGSTNANKVIGTAADGGSVSGIAAVNVYFVKSGAFRDPKFASGSTPQTLATPADGLYTQLAFTAGAINTASDVITLDRTTGNPAALGGTVNDALPVRFIGASLPGGLDANTLYYVRDALGSTFKLSVSPTDATRIDLTSTGSGRLEYALSGIPYTADVYTDSTASGHYAIQIDKRTELGSNDGNANGDGDGFQESLKDGGGYDDWFAYFDTTKLPDGPLDVYQVAVDNSGNKVVNKILAQVTNNPPSVTTVTVNGTALSASPWKVKTGATASAPFNVVIGASDSGSGAAIASTGWKLQVLDRWGNGFDVAGSADATYTNWVYGTDVGAVRDFTSKGSGSSFPVTATVPIYVNGGGSGQESSFSSGYWYRLQATTTDTDGNIATQLFWLRINNADSVRPSVLGTTLVNAGSFAFGTSYKIASVGTTDFTTIGASSNTVGTTFTANAAGTGTGTALTVATTAGAFDDLAQVSVVTGHIEDQNSTSFAATITGVTSTTVFTSSALINNAFVNVGWTVTDTTKSQTRTISAFNPATGQITVSSAFSPTEAVSDALVIKNPALVSGTIKLTGKASDDTDVTTVTVRLSTDGGATFSDLGTATKSNQTGDVVTGYTYDWSYTWDSSTLPNVAQANIVLGVYASDAVGYGTLATKAVNVVPYITSITDSTGLSADVLRGSTGKYSVSQGTGSLTVNGYNLGNVSLSSKVSATAGVVSTGVSPAPTWVSNNQITVAKAAVNLTKSGYLTVLVNGVPSPNNINDNTQVRNAQSTSDPRTALWTDDRYLWVWANTQIVPASITNMGTQPTVANLTYYNSDMVMNGNQPEFSFNDESNGITVYTTGDTAASRRTGYRLTRPSAMAEATVSGTLQRFIATSFDSTWTTSGDNTGFLEVTGFADQTTDGNGAANGPSVNTDAGLRWPTIQGIDYYAPGNTTLGVYRSTNRFPHPRLAADPSPTAGGANLALAYFDANSYHRSLNFVSFRMTGNTATNNNLATAQNGYNKSTDVSEIPTTKGASSPYFDMDKVGNNGVAVAYYDETNRRLKLATSANAVKFTTGNTATEGRTNVPTQEVSTVSISVSLRASWLGKYFTLYNGASAYSFWFDSTGTDAQPGGLTGTITRINVSATGTNTNSNANRGSFGTAIATAVNGVAGAPFAAVSGGAANPTIVTITAAQNYDTTDIASNLASGTVVGATAVSLPGSSGMTWNNLTIDSTADVGQYVSMVYDGSSKLYIAYYDFDNADLKLARVNWNGGAPTLADVTIANIDNYLSAGTWTSLMMLSDANLTNTATAQPVIAYYSDSYNGTKKPIRLAFPKFDATTGTLWSGTTNGGADDTYSGNWEVITIPATSTPQGGADQFNRVKIGAYTGSALSLPVLGWQGTKLEYAKLQPNN